MALGGAFLYASENIIQEYLIKKPLDVFNFLGFIGIFGLCTTLIEATIAGEFSSFHNVKQGVTTWQIVSNYLGMALTNFVTYSIIPFFITRCGATLLNLSNVTTIIWSMLSDILLFDGEFYPLYLLAFAVELIGIILFSWKEPLRKTQEIQDEDLKSEEEELVKINEDTN